MGVSVDENVWADAAGPNAIAELAKRSEHAEILIVIVSPKLTPQCSKSTMQKWTQQRVLL
jgi:hypothetical protein